jgi:flagellar hook-length control protein FliK
VQLRPEHLGEVLVDLRVEHGEVIASLKAEVAEVREWIQARVDELRTALQAQGLQLAHLTVGDHEGRREPNQGKGQRSEVKGKSKGQGQQSDAPPFDVHL